MGQDLARRVKLAVVFAAVGVCLGCARYNFDESGASVSRGGSAHASAVAEGDPTLAALAETGKPGAKAANLSRLARLYAARLAYARRVKDFPIGPGDVLTVSAPAVPELQNRTVRVNADGLISLPLVKEIAAAGKTEAELREAIAKALQKYVYEPHVDVFVKEYRSRQVAVIGGVGHAGLLTLTEPSETLLDVLTQSGGIVNDSAPAIVLLPVEETGARQSARLLKAAALEEKNQPGQPGNSVPAQHPEAGNQSTQNGQTVAASGGVSRPGAQKTAFDRMQNTSLASSLVSGLRNGASPIVIPLKSHSLGGGGEYLDMPVKPGDVVVVPASGEVMVVGWVQAPGHFGVYSGMTVLGVIGDAGGPMYAADTSAVRIIRTRLDGVREIVPADLDAIASGKIADIPVKGNDVIDVPYSAARIGPYILYSVLKGTYLAAPAM